MQRRSFTAALALGALGAATPARAQRPALPAAGERLLQLQPQVPAHPGATHSALVVSKARFGQHGQPYRFAGHARTLRQLRPGTPNAWEVAWLFWNYGDNDHLHYFVLKPNGWEVGKRDPRYLVPGVNDGQKIMATGESAKAVLGQWYAFDIRVAGAEAEIRVDGRLVCRFRDGDRGAFTDGRVGLYCEDALCQWHGVTAPVNEGFGREPVQAFADGSELGQWRVAFLGYGSGGIVAAPDPGWEL